MTGDGYFDDASRYPLVFAIRSALENELATMKGLDFGFSAT